MYDLDGNGELDLDEMIKIVEDIYAMQRVYSKLGANNAKPTKTAEEQASDIFAQIDEDGDGTVTEEEFLAGCLENENLYRMMVPNIF
jgi:Ca2+-binding EF-hand superfamily protein